jgi:hypothetical protein
MPLGKHERTKAGTFRRERGDSLAKNLRQDYRELEGVHGSTKLETLRNRFGVTSLNGVLEALRDQKKK